MPSDSLTGEIRFELMFVKKLIAVFAVSCQLTTYHTKQTNMQGLRKIRDFFHAIVPVAILIWVAIAIMCSATDDTDIKQKDASVQTEPEHAYPVDDDEISLSEWELCE
jgi:hypothetical protein